MENNTTIINVRGHMFDARHSRVVISGSSDRDNEIIIMQPSEPAAKEEPEGSETIDKLLPIFKGDADNVRKFLTAIRNTLPSMIPKLVNCYISEGVIIAGVSKRAIWTILHDGGFYEPTYQTWSNQSK